jgi:hypothetical protein
MNFRWLFFGGVDAKRTTASDREVSQRYQVDATGLRAVNAEVVNFADVIPPGRSRSAVMRVVAAQAPYDRSRTEPSGLALNLRQPVGILDDEVVARVLAERK